MLLSGATAYVDKDWLSNSCLSGLPFLKRSKSEYNIEQLISCEIGWIFKPPSTADVGAAIAAAFALHRFSIRSTTTANPSSLKLAHPSNPPPFAGETATAGEHRSPTGPDPISQPENLTISYSRGTSASFGCGASASSGRNSSPPRSAATVNNHPSLSFPFSGDNSHRRQQPAPPPPSTPNPRTAVIIAGQPPLSLRHRSSSEPDLHWVLVSCCFLVDLGFVYFLPGNVQGSPVFIHRGMPRRIMLAENDRDEGPRRRVQLVAALLDEVMNWMRNFCVILPIVLWDSLDPTICIWGLDNSITACAINKPGVPEEPKDTVAEMDIPFSLLLMRAPLSQKRRNKKADGAESCRAMEETLREDEGDDAASLY
ncbi:hypothetical protein FXO37_02678 [Capsicum annuum]|nr:hypothetical protein FXO37_02678 [Capsicum annuum]